MGGAGADLGFSEHGVKNERSEEIRAKRGRRAQASRFERSENSTAGGLDHFKRLRWLKIACFLVRSGEGKVSEKMSIFRELFIPTEVASDFYQTFLYICEMYVCDVVMYLLSPTILFF